MGKLARLTLAIIVLSLIVILTLPTSDAKTSKNEEVHYCPDYYYKTPPSNTVCKNGYSEGTSNDIVFKFKYECVEEVIYVPPEIECKEYGGAKCGNCPKGFTGEDCDNICKEGGCRVAVVIPAEHCGKRKCTKTSTVCAQKVLKDAERKKP